MDSSSRTISMGDVFTECRLGDQWQNAAQARKDGDRRIRTLRTALKKLQSENEAPNQLLSRVQSGLNEAFSPLHFTPLQSIGDHTRLSKTDSEWMRDTLVLCQRYELSLRKFASRAHTLIALGYQVYRLRDHLNSIELSHSFGISMATADETRKDEIAKEWQRLAACLSRVAQDEESWEEDEDLGVWLEEEIVCASWLKDSLYKLIQSAGVAETSKEPETAVGNQAG